MKKEFYLFVLSLLLLNYASGAVAKTTGLGGKSPAVAPPVQPVPNPIFNCGPIDRVPTLPPDPDGGD